jgi:hypothetical protein
VACASRGWATLSEDPDNRVTYVANDYLLARLTPCAVACRCFHPLRRRHLAVLTRSSRLAAAQITFDCVRHPSFGGYLVPVVAPCGALRCMRLLCLRAAWWSAAHGERHPPAWPFLAGQRATVQLSGGIHLVRIPLAHHHRSFSRFGRR